MSHGPRRQRRRRRCFSLLEVILAITLMIFLMGVLFRFYHSSMINRQRGVSSIKEAHLARLLLRQITDELRSAAGFVPGYGPGVIGERYELTLQALAVTDEELYRYRGPRERPLPGQHDLRQVRYFIAWDEDITDENGIPYALGLVRQELKTLRQAVVVVDGSGGDRDDAQPDEAFEDAAEARSEDVEQSFKLQLYAPEIKYLEMRYFDGAEWHRDWHVAEGNALPQIVRVTIGFETQEQEDMEIGFEDEDFELEEDEIFPPRSYTAYVRLVQADTFFGSRISRAARDLAEGGI